MVGGGGKMVGVVVNVASSCDLLLDVKGRKKMRHLKICFLFR